MGGWYLGYKDELVHYSVAENNFIGGWVLCGKTPPINLNTLLRSCFFIGYDFCNKCLQKAVKEKRGYKFEWVREEDHEAWWPGPYSFHFPEISRALRKASGFRCENCGRLCVGVYDPRLLVHHIDRDKRNDELENLIVLCDPCHGRRHRGKEWRDDVQTRMYIEEFKSYRRLLQKGVLLSPGEDNTFEA